MNWWQSLFLRKAPSLQPDVRRQMGQDWGLRERALIAIAESRTAEIILKTRETGRDGTSGMPKRSAQRIDQTWIPNIVPIHIAIQFGFEHCLPVRFEGFTTFEQSSLAVASCKEDVGDGSPESGASGLLPPKIWETLLGQQSILRSTFHLQQQSPGSSKKMKGEGEGGAPGAAIEVQPPRPRGGGPRRLHPSVPSGTEDRGLPAGDGSLGV